MARILIVGAAGRRGRALAVDLVAAGHVVRGTTRDPAHAEAIAETGAEPFVGDPDRIATLMGALAQTTVLCWLLGTATAPELHDGRLRMLFEKVVDTPVRGVLYEPAVGPPATRERGLAIARRAHETWQIPLAILEADPRDETAWLARARAGVDSILGGATR